MTRVPSVINYSVGVAQEKLDEQTIVPIIGGREASDVIPANMVLRQSITAGEIVERNSSIELFISATTTPVIEDGKMPDVTYYTEAEAIDMLRQLGAVVSIEQEYSSDIAEGIVIRGSIGTGEPLVDGAEVTLYVSMGPDPALSTDEPADPDNSNNTDEQAAVRLNRSTLSLFIGDSVALTASGGDGAYTWNSNNTGIVTVKNGSVTAVGKGSTTITVSSTGKTASCPVTVQDSEFSLSEQKPHRCWSTFRSLCQLEQQQQQGSHRKWRTGIRSLLWQLHNYCAIQSRRPQLQCHLPGEC